MDAIMKRLGVIGVHSIDHFGLQVPDLEAARRFYTTFGLDVRSEGDELTLRAFGSDHVWGRLREGPDKRLVFLSFGIYAEDEAPMLERLDRLGISRIAPPAGGSQDGVWIAGFDDLPLQIKTAEKRTPSAKSSFESVSALAGQSGAVKNSQAPQIKPARMSHFAIFTSDVIAATNWYEETLGLRLSDGSGPIVAFLHGAHGSDHHLLALVASSGRGFHHVSWDVRSVQEVGLGSSQMMRAGYKKGWGVGRHVLGANYFYYATDPWGSHCEYSADIDFIPADCDWPAADHEQEDSFYLWGPDTPDDFAKNFEAAGA